MDQIRQKMRDTLHADEAAVLQDLLDRFGMSHDTCDSVHRRAVALIKAIREGSKPSMMELFLGEYGLSSEEGVALMCLAEALLRVPDADTMDALIEDKIAPSAWNQHLGRSHSSLVNASTWALFMTGKVLNEDKTGSISGVLHGAIKRLGEPVIRQAVTRAMREMGRQFVLGETIESAMKRAQGMEEKGFTYSYDMLGEAARTDADAKRYHMAYADAIASLAQAARSSDIRANPGISIKLSALHPRYELLKKAQVMEELLPRARSLAILAKSAGIGLNIDAEEAGRLDLSLDLVEAMLRDNTLRDWDGFGVVVQAYGKRASHVIDWLHALAEKLDRRIMVRLVKGAYWDTEIKLAQVEGLPGFPVFTRKASTDVSYICCARQLLGMTDRIYPQFATHNAHSVAAILEMSDSLDRGRFEFQRLHGMGESLHSAVMAQEGTRCRIYAPVGTHRDLLAYLVRRLLENGANSSFVNQIVDEDVSPQKVAADPFEAVAGYMGDPHNPQIRMPADLFQPARLNSRGWDLTSPDIMDDLRAGLAERADEIWSVAEEADTARRAVRSPTTGEIVGHITFADADTASAACDSVRPWEASAAERAAVLRKASELYEARTIDIFARLTREAGKTLLDCVGEIREAVDFLRYYATRAENAPCAPAGVFTCISPWNFPLAIFTGQIAAALAAGNGVLAKPAETTSLIAHFAVECLYEAGVPRDVLRLVPGDGAVVGPVLTGHPRVDGVAFTGSTATAQRINRTMAEHLAPHAPLIAETGGLNAMIVDSTALPEQAIRDVVASAFQSAGQRCSALRVLYLQKDIAAHFLEMLKGAMDALKVGDPSDFTTDIGPVIDAPARDKIMAHIDAARAQDRILHQVGTPQTGTFVPPTVIRVDGIGDLEEEIFGPVLHVAEFAADEIEDVITAINGTGYGLTFGMHSRIDDRVDEVIRQVDVGNVYINRNQIGAVVGSQPFGGDGLSGTGPKAGGPRYLPRFCAQELHLSAISPGLEIARADIEAFFRSATPKTEAEAISLPGPTGESNRYLVVPRRHVLCLGPGAEQAEAQASAARALGCCALACAPGVTAGIDGVVTPQTLRDIDNLDAVVLCAHDARAFREALAAREGAIVPLLMDADFANWLVQEKSICVDTTASGGNTQLLMV